MNDKCVDNRFEIIKRAKEDILSNTNIESSLDEMQVIDNFLFRCWQMGWLERYNDQPDYVKLPEDGYEYLRKCEKYIKDNSIEI